MSKKAIVLGLFVGLGLILSIPYSGQAKASSRVIRVEITSDGRFVPDRILVKQDEDLIFRVTAHKSNELTWPMDVLHGFDLMYDNILLVRTPIKVESLAIDKAKIIDVRWTFLFTGEFALRCPYHRHKFGTVIVKQ